MTRLHILAVLLVSVYGVASRPTEMTNSPATESVNARLTFGNPIELPGSSPLSNRFKRADQTAQSHNGIRYNGMTIKLPEGEGYLNHLAASSSSTEKPKKPINRMARIHIRIG
ncbi:hypothetical protein DAPPUDRAFT_327046 [Daphnia pulex]|uniref:Uncharacterized protein n=1 Tax=Daphnia pulex TaxID=6669 RepID=E9H9K0_DAPPU|nr:hypothetical protein DAPPUDRAFT_327046 [Daphnia pulex]|eukprot:EFX71637.1 hypothetical protein DAPPUDRAFT_327046 [Daphnia pulex]